jgi:hypothetical protein
MRKIFGAGEEGIKMRPDKVAWWGDSWFALLINYYEGDKKKFGMRWDMRPLLVQKLEGKDHLADLDLEW